jgi:translocation and assembly module TamB
MRAGRLAKRVIKLLLLGTLGLLVGVLLIAQLALSLPEVRGLVRKEAVKLGSEALEAKLEVDHLDLVSLTGHVELRGARLHDAHGDVVASVQRVAARFDPLALLLGRLRFGSLRLTQPHVDLGAPADPESRRGLLGVFAKEPPQPAPQAESGSAMVVVLDGVEIERGTLLVDHEGERWSASDLNLAGSLEIADALAGQLERLRARIARGDQPAATLRQVRGEFAPDGAAELHAEIEHGAARLSVEAELGEPGDGGERALDAHVRAQGIDGQTLAGFGVALSELRAPVGLELRARGTTHALHAELLLRTPGGDLDVRGDYDQKRGASARVHTERLEPARFLRAQVAEVALTLNVSAKPDPELPSAAVRAVIESGRYGAMALPHTTLRGRVRPEGVWLDELLAQYEHGRLSARGRLGEAGDLQADVEVQSAALSELPPVRAFAPELSGVLDAKFHAQRGTGGPIALKAGVELREAALGDVQTQALAIEGQVVASGSDDARVKLQAAATALEVGGEDLGYAEVELHGGPDRYRARVSLGERGRLRAEIQRTSRDAIATRGEGRFSLGEHGLVQARWDEIGYASGEVRLRDVNVDYCGARARLDGTFDPDGRSALRAHVESADLTAATRTLLEQPIPGALVLDAELQGESERPRVEVKARYRDGALAGLDELSLDVDAEADLAARTLAVRAEGRANGGTVELDVESELARGKPSLAILQRGRHQVALELDDVPLHELAAWPVDKTIPERARLSGELRVKGELERFATAFDLRSRLRFRGDSTPVFARVRGDYSDTELALQIDARDPRGPLVRSSVRTQLEKRPFGTMPDEPLDALEKQAWQASLSLASRRVQDLPAVRALEVHPALLPALVAAELEIEHEPLREPEAELRVSAVWDPPGEHTEAPRCGLSRPVKIALAADMKGGELTTHVRGHLADQQVLEVKTASHAPIDEWFDPGPPSQVRPVSLRARLASLQLRDVPVVCEDAFGLVSAEIDVARAGSEQVSAKVDLAAHDVHLGRAPAFDGKLSASADRNALAVWADIRGNYTGHASIRGRVPIDGGGRAPTIDLDSPSSLRVVLDKLDARTLLAAVPNVRATRGKLDGRIALDSPLRTPKVKGALAVRNAAVTLPTLGQRFEEVNGDLLLTGKTVHLEDLALQDREGKAKLSGEFTLHDLTSFETKLRAKANDFPVRRSGVMIARLDGELGVQAQVRPGRTEAEVSLRDARVELTDQSLADVQSLQDNPQIILVDEFGEEIEQEEEDDAQDEPAVTIIRIDADEPFWIRRTDFSVLVRAELLMEMRDEQPHVSGEVEIERGVVELLGQMFDIERGRIEFVGGREAKPRLDLVAVRKVPGGATVTVQAQGAVDEPELTFLVDGEPVTAGDALSAATGTGTGRGGGESAEQQVGAFATGLATGVLTLGARNEIGEWMPVLAVENEDGAARLRAGVEAGRLIPRFLRKVVVDAYLEGSLSSAPEAEDRQSSADNDRGPDAAVLLELRHPHDFVSEAQYGPGTQWSFDFLWEP